MILDPIWCASLHSTLPATLIVFVLQIDQVLYLFGKPTSVTGIVRNSRMIGHVHDSFVVHRAAVCLPFHTSHQSNRLLFSSLRGYRQARSQTSSTSNCTGLYPVPSSPTASFRRQRYGEVQPSRCERWLTPKPQAPTRHL